MTVYFANEGVIDLRAITTFGVSAKEGENPIGFFGTGLKYAIAILLRAEGKITIYQGLEEIKFTSQPEVIRGQSFNIVHANDQPLGFTTDLGKTWEMWQAFRELYCNTIDEGGEVTLTPCEPRAGWTIVKVQSKEFEEWFYKKGAIVLDSTPLYKDSRLEVHQGPSEVLHYRKIRAGGLEKPSIFTYNILAQIGLTEDRTLKNSWEAEGEVRIFVTDHTDKAFIKQFLQAPENSWENNISLKSYSRPSDEFLEVGEEVWKDKRNHCNPTLFRVLQKYCEKTFDIIVGTELTSIEKQQLEKAIAFCEVLGFNVSEFPITIVESLDGDCLGKVMSGTGIEKKVLLSRKAFSMGTKMLAGTLFEEWVHLSYGHHDESRAMQNFLIDKLMSLGEEFLGEPL